MTVLALEQANWHTPHFSRCQRRYFELNISGEVTSDKRMPNKNQKNLGRASCFTLANMIAIIPSPPSPEAGKPSQEIFLFAMSCKEYGVEDFLPIRILFSFLK